MNREDLDRRAQLSGGPALGVGRRVHVLSPDCHPHAKMSAFYEVEAGTVMLHCEKCHRVAFSLDVAQPRPDDGNRPADEVKR